MHIGDLDGVATVRKSGWTAKVTVYVHDGAHNPVVGATVSGQWTSGATGVSSCVTDRRGRCFLTSPRMTLSTPSVTFSAQSIDLTGYNYASGQNHDPDGDSDGTSIVVAH